MSKHAAVDCQGLAGAWTLGTVETGRFKIVGRASLPGGFGDDCFRTNEKLLGVKGVEVQEGVEPDWEPYEGVAYVHGTPPCSGFSLMNVSKGENSRGAHSPINSCMRDLATFGGRCVGADGEQGAEVISLESVQQAYSTGRDLMLHLRDIVEKTSGQKYDLTHVKMSGASIGAAQARHRYYWVAHRIPFGADAPEPRKVVTYEEAIGDLRGLRWDTWDDQRLRRKPSEWAARLRREDGKADSHITINEETVRLVALLGEIEDDWLPGENMKEAIIKQEEPPATLLRRFPYDLSNWRDPRGWQWPTRIRPDRPGYVVAGSGVSKFVHWSEPRFLTIREISRLMGYPDEWRWPEGVSIANASKYVGKCCPCDSGRWISGWVARALDGEPGEPGKPVGDREYEINNSLDYRRWPVEISGWVPRPEPWQA